MLDKELILKTVLKDDEQENGGVSFEGETLRNFMEEIGIIDEDLTLDILNAQLESCGIKRLYAQNYPELFSYKEFDILPNFENNYDFLDDFMYVVNDVDDLSEPEIDNTFVEDIILENLYLNVFPNIMAMDATTKTFSSMHNTYDGSIAINFIDFDDDVSIRCNYTSNPTVNKD